MDEEKKNEKGGGGGKEMKERKRKKGRMRGGGGGGGGSEKEKARSWIQIWTFYLVDLCCNNLAIAFFRLLLYSKLEFLF